MDGSTTPAATGATSQVQADQETQATSQEGKEAAKEFQAITSQEQLDSIIKTRLERERAKFSDYDELKTIAAKAAKSDAELRDRLKQLEAANQRREWVDEISETTGVPASLLRGESREEIEAHAKAIAEVYKTPNRVVVAGQAKQPAAGSTPEQKLVRELFGNS